MKRSFICAVIFIQFIFPSALFSREDDNGKFDLEQQIKCEKEFIKKSRAKEVFVGPEYQILLEVAVSFGREHVPHLYLIKNKNCNAWYMGGSVLVDKSGKLFMLKNCVSLFDDRNAIKGFLAHEVAHLAQDDGSVPCYINTLHGSEVEEAANLLAAEKVGYPFIVAFLEKMGALGMMTMHEVNLRLQALSTIPAE